MTVAAIINALDMMSVALIVCAVGLKWRAGLGLAFLRHHPAEAAAAMLAMFGAVPAFVLLLTWLLPLNGAVTLALLALSVSPMPPVLPIMEKQAGGKPSYIAGTLLMAPLAAFIAIPVLVWAGGHIHGRAVVHDPWQVFEILLMTLALPLLVGLLVGRLAPALAARLLGPVTHTGNILLGVVTVALVIHVFGDIVAALGNGTLMVIVVTAAFGLVIGHLAGGPYPGNRRALALICSQRHPGVAMAIAVAAVPEQAPATLAAVVLHMLAASAMALPYLRWQRSGGPG